MFGDSSDPPPTTYMWPLLHGVFIAFFCHEPVMARLTYVSIYSNHERRDMCRYIFIPCFVRSRCVRKSSSNVSKFEAANIWCRKSHSVRNPSPSSSPLAVKDNQIRMSCRDCALSFIPFDIIAFSNYDCLLCVLCAPHVSYSFLQFNSA